MANIVIGNNGSEFKLATDETPEQAETPTLKITDESGNIITIKPNVSVGLPLGKYVIEVL